MRENYHVIFPILEFGVCHIILLNFFSLSIYKNVKKSLPVYCPHIPKPKSLSCITFAHTEYLTNFEINSNQCKY